MARSRAPKHLRANPRRRLAIVLCLLLLQMTVVTVMAWGGDESEVMTTSEASLTPTLAPPPTQVITQPVTIQPEQTEPPITVGPVTTSPPPTIVETTSSEMTAPVTTEVEVEEVTLDMESLDEVEVTWTVPERDPLPTLPEDVTEEDYLRAVTTTTTEPPDPGEDGWTRSEIEGVVAQYFSGYGYTWAVRVIQCESQFDPYATNSSSGAAGLFQHLPRYWSERSSSAGWGGADIYNVYANIAVAAWLYYEDGPSHWVCK